MVRIFVDEAVNHFTVAELHALVRFYGSPEGRSVLLKTGSFTRDLQRELATAVSAEIAGSAPPRGST